MTTENDKYHGPAASHLTLYIEPVNGKLRLAAQDIQNNNMPHGLTQGAFGVGTTGSYSTAIKFCSATASGTASRRCSSSTAWTWRGVSPTTTGSCGGGLMGSS